MTEALPACKPSGTWRKPTFKPNQPKSHPMRWLPPRPSLQPSINKGATSMRTLQLSMLLLPALLLGCAAAPRVIVQAVCPAIPLLEQPSALLEPTFSDKIQSFLSGRLDELTSSDYSLPSVKLPTTQLGTH